VGSWTAAFYTTTDGGSTLATGSSPFRKNANQATPPSPSGRRRTPVLRLPRLTSGAYQTVRLVVAKSDRRRADLTQSGVVAESQGTPFIDKPYIACAPNGTGIYAPRDMSWTHFGTTTSPIRVAYFRPIAA